MGEEQGGLGKTLPTTRYCPFSIAVDPYLTDDDLLVILLILNCMEYSLAYWCARIYRKPLIIIYKLKSLSNQLLCVVIFIVFFTCTAMELESSLT